MTLRKDVGNTHGLPKTGKEQIFTYMEAVNSLLQSRVTNSNVATAASDVVCSKNASEETLVQFVDALCSKVVRCGNACPEKRNKEVFIDVLPASMLSAVQFF